MRERRRLSDADLTPEQKAAAETRRARWQTPEYQEGLAQDIAAIRQEFPPRLVAENDLTIALADFRLQTLISERRRQETVSRAELEREIDDRA